jgi:ABC-type lipoprotein release transport system permease subunit
MESVLFGITTHDPVTFTLLPALIAVTTLVACSIPARRAARVNPAAMIRGE